MSQTSGKKAYYIANPVTGWAQMPYNTKEVLTESGEWESPITGWVKVTCIGGGGAGASMGTTNGTTVYSIRENFGGNTSFGDVVAYGGYTLGGEAVAAATTGSGGFAGGVETTYIQVAIGDIFPVIIGSGGAVTGTFKTLHIDNICKDYPSSGWGPLITTTSPRVFAGSFGGSNGTPYGGGGGTAGAATGGAGNYPGVGAGGGANGSTGQLTTSHTINLGGHGGDGAVILEYADPKKKS